MAGPNGFSRITIGAAQALTGYEAAEVAIFLPATRDDKPVLYRDAGSELSLPDFERLRRSGVSSLYVQCEDLRQCEAIVERKLGELLASSDLPSDEKAKLVHQVGTGVARDLVGGSACPDDLTRASRVVDNVIGCILRDPLVAGHLLHMTAHSRNIASHMFVVSALAIMLGAEVFGAHQEMLHALGLAGMMHDLGKLSIGAEILNKRAPLTPEEVKLIHQHPIESVRLIGDDPQVGPPTRQIILQHHEWVNGRGYPIGVCGPDLLPGSRILTIVDCFHAMIGRRPYRTPFTPPEANRALQAHADRQFDADMLACWNELFERRWSQAPPLPAVDPGVGSDELSTRHEHRPMQPPRQVFGLRQKRFECNGSVSVKCVYAGRLHDATAAPDEFVAAVRDVSRGGLCIYSSHPMYRGEFVHIQIDQGGRGVWVRGTVAWCRQHDPGTYRIGLRLLRRIPDQESHGALGIESLADLDQGTGETSDAAGSSAPAPSSEPEPDWTSKKRENALEMLVAIDKMRSVTPDAERTAIVLSSSPDPLVRRKAVDTLARIKTKAARTALIARLRDDDPEVREHTVTVAGALHMSEACYLLLPLLEDPVDRVALRAAGALGRMGERDGLPLVREYLKSHRPHVRLAAQALGDIVGHRFPANAEGVNAARRYLAATEPRLNPPSVQSTG